MTGWGFLALVLAVFVATLLGFAWGAAWQRDEQAAKERSADELARRRRSDFYWQPSVADRRRIAMAEHPAGGER